MNLVSPIVHMDRAGVTGLGAVMARVPLAGDLATDRGDVADQVNSLVEQNEH